MLVNTVRWQEIRAQINKVNPYLCRLIDEINPSGELDAFVIAGYPFGHAIVENDHVQFSMADGESISIEKLPSKIRHQIDYASIPISVLLNRASEIYIEVGQKIVPQSVMYPGDIIGIYRSLVQRPQPYYLTWRLSSGVRSLFMLPNVNDTANHKRLAKRFKLSEHLPKTLFDHWHVFKAIAASTAMSQPWTSNVMILTKHWYEKIRDSDAQVWLKLKNYLLSQVCDELQSPYGRAALISVHSKIAQIVSEKRFNSSHYCIDTIKHIMAIQSGYVPGFQISDDQEVCAPTKDIQAAYVTYYNLKNYLPVLMTPCIWKGAQMKSPVYYSLNLPTLLDGQIPNQVNIRKTELLYKIKVVLDELSNEAYHYQYIHNQSMSYEMIVPADQVVLTDPNLERLKQKFPGKIFPNTSPYMKGCIQVNLNVPLQATKVREAVKAQAI